MAEGQGSYSVEERYVVYADKQIVNDDMRRVLEHFAIPAGHATFKTDSHYQSTRPLRPKTGCGTT